MKIIGLCGGSGSGKGAVSSLFGNYGIPAIDTDAVYHDITSHPSDCLDALASEFGPSVVNGGRLDRATLREIVFNSPDSAEKLNRLNAITHKYIIDETEKIISAYEKNGFRGVIIDAPLLFESGLDKRCDTVIAVLANREVRIARIMLRDGITLDAARARIDAQLSDAELVNRANIIIRNDGRIDELKSAVRLAYEQIFEK